MKTLSSSFKKLLGRTDFILAVYLIIAVSISMQQYFLGAKSETYSHYNNYLIFKQSFFHFISGKDLYALYPLEHYDYYKYSPTFAFFMGVFAYLPDLLGLICWNSINALALFLAFRALPFSDLRIKTAIMWFVIVELITTIQNSQSNALIAGLLILSFNFLERKFILWGTLMIVLTVFIKIFGLVAFSLFFLYPEKKKFILYSAIWMALLFALPLIIISPVQLISMYDSWGKLLQMDFSGSLGISLVGWLHTWFHFDPSKNFVTLIGIIIFCIPLLFYKRYSQLIFRLLFLSNILIWVIIFNHKAESATFIISVCGIAIWYFYQEKNILNLSLIILAFVFTCLSPTDLFPPAIRNQFFIPYTIKVVPCIFIWMKIISELIFKNYSEKKFLHPS